MSPLTTHLLQAIDEGVEGLEGALSSTPGEKIFFGGHAMQKLTIQLQHDMTANFRHTSKKIGEGICKKKLKKKKIKTTKRVSNYRDLTVRRGTVRTEDGKKER
jgi:hypothetical protein